MFGQSAVDTYKLQSHTFEKRFGIAGISTALGYSKEWFGRLPSQGVKQFKALQRDGFTGCQIDVRVPQASGKRGASIAKTISIRDFNKIIAYEALKKKNIKAIILLVSFSERGLENLVNDAFAGISLDWFAENIAHYSQWTYEEFEEVLQYNREEIRALYSWNDDPIDDDWDLAFRLNLELVSQP
ncbi:hypothetical protein [Nodularia sp. NIES-3585]|uniref:hypothetical protein n=1 Tax=Nodularia sp. NIES-3585 TaxID=1973477 RepID=UPI000B5CB819|nr:hypothetical protein [Nodularia sp. NIES-3585]GAX37788.1 hypothetical protein NIES3585_38330 [Nodularia sp. NIES-3585]